MKSADIEVGKEYAVGRDYDAKDRGSGRTLARARVEEVKAERKYWPADGWRQHTANDGVRVAILDNETGEPAFKDGEPLSGVLRPAEIRQPWDEYVTEEAERKQRREAHAAKKKAEQDAAQARLDGALSTAGLTAEDLPRAVLVRYPHEKLAVAELLEKVSDDGYRRGGEDARSPA